MVCATATWLAGLHLKDEKLNGGLQVQRDICLMQAPRRLENLGKSLNLPESKLIHKMKIIKNHLTVRL